MIYGWVDAELFWVGTFRKIPRIPFVCLFGQLWEKILQSLLLPKRAC